MHSVMLDALSISWNLKLGLLVNYIKWV